VTQPVQIPAGTVLELPPGTWRHGEGVLRIRVERVLHELSRYYHEEIWIEGTRLHEDGSPDQWIQVLVRVDALPED